MKLNVSAIMIVKKEVPETRAKCLVSCRALVHGFPCEKLHLLLKHFPVLIDLFEGQFLTVRLPSS